MAEPKFFPQVSIVEKVEMNAPAAAAAAAAGKMSMDDDDDDVNFNEAVAVETSEPADGGWASNAGWNEANNEAAAQPQQDDNWASWHEDSNSNAYQRQTSRDSHQQVKSKSYFSQRPL